MNFLPQKFVIVFTQARGILIKRTTTLTKKINFEDPRIYLGA
jgi:hypothetical protein